MSNRKGKSAPPGEQENDAAKLLAAANALINEPASDFLPAQQKVEFLRKNLEKAQRKAERAIELDGSLAAAHHLLGVVCERAGLKPAAAHSFVRATQLHAGSDADLSTRDAAWAESAARAFELVVAMATAEALPTWWTDEALLALSERAVQLLPDSPLANRWWAESLAGFPGCAAHVVPTRAMARTPEQLRLAAAHFAKAAAQLGSAAAEGEHSALVQAGAACLKDALQAERLRREGGGDGDADGESAARAARDAEAKAAKNRKKKLAKRNKAGVEGAAANDDAGGAASVAASDGVVPARPAVDAAAALAAAGAVTAAASDPPPPVPLAGYRWAALLPEGYQELLGQMGIVPGAPVSAVDLKGVVAEGGPAVAVAVGLLEPFDGAAVAKEVETRHDRASDIASDIS